MRIERAVNYITTLGPGKRLGIWVNGCKRGCPKCVSERLQKYDSTTEVDIKEFLKDFNLINIDGVTISGGEPFEQPEELNILVTFLLEKGIEDILVYTGFTLEELIQLNDVNINEILTKIAVLIDGPYIYELDDQKNNIKGSSNQRIIYLKKFFQQSYELWIQNKRNMQEMIIGNTMLAVGIPEETYIEKFKKG